MREKNLKGNKHEILINLWCFQMSDDKETIRAEARKMMLQTDYSRAIERFKDILKKYPDDEEVILDIGLCYQYSKRHKEALQYFDQLIKVNPLQIAAYDGKVSSFIEMKKHDEAIHVLQEIKKMEPTSVTTLEQLARLFMIKNQHQKVIEVLEELIQLDDKWQNGVNLAQAYQKIGESKKAIDLLEKLMVKSSHPVPTFILGTVYQDLKDFEKAILMYEKAVTLNPEFLDAWGKMGESHEALGNYQKSLDCFNKILVVNPNNELVKKMINKIKKKLK